MLAHLPARLSVCLPARLPTRLLVYLSHAAFLTDPQHNCRVMDGAEDSLPRTTEDSAAIQQSARDVTRVFSELTKKPELGRHGSDLTGWCPIEPGYPSCLAADMLIFPCVLQGNTPLI